MEKQTNEKKVLIFSTIAVVLLIVVVVGATYAFFVAQGGGSSNTNVNVQTNTTDNLSFSVGDAISITANQDNFAQGLGNQAGSTTASATLTANNATNTATRNYYLYLNITSNDFEYTVDNDTPELILTVTDPNGSPVENISGLDYVTVGEGDNQVSGFDITTASELITLASNYEITATTDPEIQEWTITVTFVNLETDQVGNAGKTFVATVMIQETPLTSSQNLASYITDTLYTADGVNGLYLHDGIGSYTNADQEAGDNSYRFSGGDYQVTATATGANLIKVYTAADAETDGVINFYCNGTKRYVGYRCTATQTHYYTTAYNEGTHYNTLEEALSQAVTDGYLTADNIKNFVCFGPGASEGSCSEDNLYRIIGVFNNQVKLIKYDYADTTMLGSDGDYYTTESATFWSGMRKDAGTRYLYYWNGPTSSGGTLTNDWGASRLNTVNLNTNYWNYLTSDWQTKIANTTWKVGGNTTANIYEQTVKSAYTNEIVSPAEVTTYQDEIGLMYVSDYMYAVDPTGWTKTGYDNNSPSNPSNDYRGVKGDNWMYMGGADWTISRRSDLTNGAFSVSFDGCVYYTTVNVSHGVRPVFYLNSNVEFSGGTGTLSNPYRILL